MKKRYALMMIIVGIIIGLGISVKFDWINNIGASDYFVEEKSETQDYKQLSNAFINAAKKVSPATVYIFSEQAPRQRSTSRRNPFFDDNDPFREFFGDDFFERFFGGRPEREQRKQSLGSGIIVSPDGYLITNNHVVENAEKIKITMLNNPTEYEAKLIGADKKSDIAILKIEGNHKNLPYAKLGNSDNLEVGEWVIAIGNPFGFSHTVTAGIVSALGRNLGISMYEDFIQTDCSINPGNSGGPMINLNGNIIGINTAIYSRSGGNQGIGFAIPINMVKKIMIDLVEKGAVRRGYLGVSISDVNETLAEKFGLKKDTRGALVSQVFQNSPADKAEMKEGDIIVEFDGVPINDSNKLKHTVAITPIDKTVKVKVFRDGSEKIIEIKIVEQPENMEEAAAGAESGGSEYTEKELGLTTRSITPELAKQYGINERLKGVVVTAVERGSIAERGGLRRGDAILGVDRIAVSNTAEFQKALERTKKTNNIMLQIQRGNQRFFMILSK